MLCRSANTCCAVTKIIAADFLFIQLTMFNALTFDRIESFVPIYRLYQILQSILQTLKMFKC